ncbi:glycosyltransferase family 2 protein [Pedobacter jejuensis]|uniref:Glycosyltransferase family 2 protein n=1 Tax=Pedobacter jejuensis TaxID=1268550 RepID=A0A3N0BQ78_9SPHI|nr:glycosyltransferase family 2 protein [Pedobacter jejuensis]RNL51141.1 glycosyltransferase family 2 protein [Pedobacter jejuensis]
MINFSFIILTYNEEVHLPRLLNSINDLNADTYILDSGSTDKTVEIATEFGALIKVNPFENHPKQWDFALKNFEIKTPWIIALDADQFISDELYKMLENFNNDDYRNINSIYFNRKNYFQGKWIRFGGYYPFYLLKMFRTDIGYSDLNENMDHRFIVPGKSAIWKEGYLIENNLKENDINFWLEKHHRYSDLIAAEEVDRMLKIRNQVIKASLFGNPDERRAWFKKLWWKLPLGIRPYLYFTYRMIFQLGILDGKTGIRFHYLQALWFRLLVDKKIKSLQNKSSSNPEEINSASIKTIKTL